MCNRIAVFKRIPLVDQFKNEKEGPWCTPGWKSPGCVWNIEDWLSYRVQHMDKPLTKQILLSTQSSVYDPLGLGQPLHPQGQKGVSRPLPSEERLGWANRARLLKPVAPMDGWLVGYENVEDTKMCLARQGQRQLHYFADALGDSLWRDDLPACPGQPRIVTASLMMVVKVGTNQASHHPSSEAAGIHHSYMARCSAVKGRWVLSWRGSTSAWIVP